MSGSTSNSESRWWEFYFVRYFIGTTVGAIIVLILVLSEDSALALKGELGDLVKSIQESKFETAHTVGLGMIGLTFCYISSAPILVLHATRGYLIAKWRGVKEIVYVLTVLLSLATSLIQVYETLGRHLGKTNLWKSPEFYIGVACLSVASSLILFQFAVLFAAFKDQKAFEYYDDIVKKRAQRTRFAKEYTESYRHLREHGNAFLIVIFECLLGATLYYSPIPSALVLALWIAPSAAVWVFGTVLESRKF